MVTTPSPETLGRAPGGLLLTVAFIGVTHHFRYTKSSQFFIDVLNDAWANVAVMSSEWRWVHLPRRKRWDLAVFWQHFPEPWELGALPVDRIVLIPMDDDCPHDKEFWEQYLGCRVLCFSQSLGVTLEGWGHDVLRVQYFPPAPSPPIFWPDGPMSAFFWPRKPDLTWNHVRPLLEGAAWKGFQYHLTEADAWAKPEPENAPAPLRITGWFPSREAFSHDLVQNQVFFAPRRAEGIGLSFLEALGLGMAVVAVDGPTMNEYIRSGENGYLFDPDRPVAPDWSKAPSWGRTARRDFLAGRERWLESVPAILDFLRSSPPIPRGPTSWKAIRKRWVTLAKYGVFQFLNALRWLKKWAKNALSRGPA